MFMDSVGFKSPATISQAQETAQYDGTSGTLAARGRHDPCVVPRAVPIVEEGPVEVAARSHGGSVRVQSPSNTGRVLAAKAW